MLFSQCKLHLKTCRRLLSCHSSIPKVHERSPHEHSFGSEKRQSGVTWLEKYEYVVVGSGPGGGPLAARLAIGGFKVLLIDAGDDQGSTYQEQVPALQLQSTEYGPMKWDYFVSHYADRARQEKDSKMTWRTSSRDLCVGTSPPIGSTPLGILYPRSRTLGGCSAHTALITIYPHESDWSNIESITGDSSWSPANMRPYFEKLERNGYLPSGIIGHGYNGWLGTSLTSLSLVIEDQNFCLVSFQLRQPWDRVFSAFWWTLLLAWARYCCEISTLQGSQSRKAYTRFHCQCGIRLEMVLETSSSTRRMR